MKEAYKQKQIIIDEIKDKFERAESAVVIDYMGITVAEADEMRKKLREAEVDYTVYKNTLVKRAIEGTKYEALGEILEGPSGFAFSYDDATAPARVLNDARKAYKKMEFKGGIIEGEYYDKENIEKIAAIQNEYAYTIGRRRMEAVLQQRDGIKPCETTLQRLMSANGLGARIRRARK